MAKALFGFVGGPTNEELNEVVMLRRKITDLETEVLRLKCENDELNAAWTDHVERLSTEDLFEPLAR